MTVLAIDPSTTSVGFAVYQGGVPALDGYFVPEAGSPLKVLQSIQRLMDFLGTGGFGVQGTEQLAAFGCGAEPYNFLPFDALACERMFVSAFQGNAVALLNVIPKQLRAWAEDHSIKFVELHNATVKKTIGANALQKQQPKLTTKQAVYACVERYMSAEAKALPLSHRLDVSDAHAIAWTAIKKLAKESGAPSTRTRKSGSKETYPHAP